MCEAKLYQRGEQHLVADHGHILYISFFVSNFTVFIIYHLRPYRLRAVWKTETRTQSDL